MSFNFVNIGLYESYLMMNFAWCMVATYVIVTRILSEL